jgi:nicotinate-nucleotide--dimethylbenzimidazole phosphoribosyltransferase
MSNTESVLYERIGEITGLHIAAMDAARKRQAELAKPPGSLGRLEDLSVQLAGITGQVRNTLEHKELLVFCADNGVVEEGVSSAPQSVTLSQTVNLTRRKTGASVIAGHFGCRVRVCDIGVNADISEPAVIHRKIAYGTQNIANTAAMTREQAVRAILTGMELGEEAVRDGANVIGIGEMGIGNTTTSSAVLAVLTERAVSDVTGRGGGITDESYRKKLRVIETAIQLNQPDKNDVIDVLAKVGGFDLSAMCGAFLGAARARVPAVIDGFISVVAALCAVRLCPTVREYLIPSHASYEIGYRIVIEELGLAPLFDLGMRLGEGSGCPIAMMMLDAACAVMNDMATFEEADINDDYLTDIRRTDAFTVKGD